MGPWTSNIGLGKGQNPETSTVLLVGESLTLSGWCGLCLIGRSLLGLTLKVSANILFGLEFGIYE